eukprot:Pompholyxophrys_punicea_v1_NODE_563_length_1684_cov_1.659300.p3 type:complete len:109 gc:universal NODE_563_length_1684_cov_1.659300:1002-676(-)
MVQSPLGSQATLVRACVTPKSGSMNVVKLVPASSVFNTKVIQRLPKSALRKDQCTRKKEMMNWRPRKKKLLHSTNTLTIWRRQQRNRRKLKLDSTTARDMDVHGDFLK